MRYILLLSGIILNTYSFAQHFNHDSKKEYQVAAYYFPNYHVDTRNEKYFGKGWTEWKLVQKARPRFSGHQQPKVPLWGYTDESDPQIMKQKIEMAASHGIDAFIFDWYYYDDGPFLQNGLEKGFMQAPNNSKLKFCLMWANHDYTDVFGIPPHAKRKLMFPGKISWSTWDQMTTYIIEKYFKHPSYWMIDGAPYFSVYDIGMFIKSFDSIEGAKKAIEEFRRKTKAAGFRDLHLNGIVWGVLPTSGIINSDPAHFIKTLPFNSCTSYVWYHHGGFNHFPGSAYDSVKNAYFKFAVAAHTQLSVPYYPNVTMGWDPSPRTKQQVGFENAGYPHTPVIIDNTPERFKKALIQVREYVDSYFTKNKIVTVNAWNEWTEGSYLEPDSVNKMGYLNAVRDVFGN